MLETLIELYLENFLKKEFLKYPHKTIRMFKVSVTENYPDTALFSIESLSKDLETWIYFIIVKEYKQIRLRYIEILDIDTWDSTLLEVNDMVEGNFIIGDEIIQPNLDELIFVDDCIENFNNTFLKQL